MENNEITIIASDLLGAEKTRKVMEKNDQNHRIVLGTGSDLPRISKSQVENGAKVLIAFGIFAKIIRQSVDVPVVMIDILPEDVIDALLEAASLSHKVAVVGFRKVLGIIEKMRSLLSIDLQMFPTVMPEEMEKLIAGMEPDRVLIAGYYQSRIAEKYKIRCVVIKPRDSEIEKALVMAENVIQEQKKRGEEKRQNLPESSIYAMITVDMDDRVVLMNRLASQYLGVAQLNAVTFSVGEICPEFTRIHDSISKQETYINQIARIGNRTFLYHVEPLWAEGIAQGAIVTFQDTEAVLQEERNIRRKLSVKSNCAQYSLDQILGTSESMTQALKMAVRYAVADETVLILGETGVGKELFAQGIHRASCRSKAPFVAINCASLPENILESELFGYVRGAFTGADREGKKGLFEQAHGGTIFLDEIGEISQSMQGKLLRVLQEHSIRRVGGDKPIPVDIRVIAATNRDLVREVCGGNFRRDLYFRLNVLALRIPSLRERREDIILLARHFLEEASMEMNRTYSFSSEAEKFLSAYAWPGNVRELQNLIRRAVVMIDGEQIGADFIGNYIRENEGLIKVMNFDIGKERRTEQPQGMIGQGNSYVAEKKTNMTLDEALRTCGNNRKRAAELLGISRATLYRWLDKERRNRYMP